MSLNKSDVKAIKPDELSPAATCRKAIVVGQTKANMDADRMFVASVLAGAFISFGALLFLLVMSDASLSFSVSRLLGGLVFGLGLVLVLCCGAELFTGNTLLITAYAARKITWSSLAKNWIIVWLGNMLGALIAVALIWFSQVYSMNDGAVGEVMVSVALGKVTPDWFTLFIKGILCNVFVSLAVWIGFSARTVTDKVLGILLPIMGFVACGFEHCIANMFFLPMGYLMNMNGCGIEGSLTLSGIAMNISAATLGNIVGGLIVGLAYWYIYRVSKMA